MRIRSSFFAILLLGCFACGDLFGGGSYDDDGDPQSDAGVSGGGNDVDVDAGGNDEVGANDDAGAGVDAGVDDGIDGASCLIVDEDGNEPENCDQCVFSRLEADDLILVVADLARVDCQPGFDDELLLLQQDLPNQVAIQVDRLDFVAESAQLPFLDAFGRVCDFGEALPEIDVEACKLLQTDFCRLPIQGVEVAAVVTSDLAGRDGFDEGSGTVDLELGCDPTQFDNCVCSARYDVNFAEPQ